MRRFKTVWNDSNLPRCRLIRFKFSWIDSMAWKTYFWPRVRSQIIPKISILIPNIPKTIKIIFQSSNASFRLFLQQYKATYISIHLILQGSNNNNLHKTTDMSLSIHEMTISTTLNNKHNSQSWIQPQFNNTISQFINLSKIHKVPISI